MEKFTGKSIKHTGMELAHENLNKIIANAKGAPTITIPKAKTEGQLHSIISAPQGTLVSFFDQKKDTTHDYWLENAPILPETGWIFFEPENSLNDRWHPAYTTPSGKNIYHPPTLKNLPKKGDKYYHQELVDMLTKPTQQPQREPGFVDHNVQGYPTLPLII